MGNITNKTDFGVYQSGSAAGIDELALGGTGSQYGPHQVGSVTKSDGTIIDYHYDRNGNLVEGNGRSIAYDLNQKPTLIAMSDGRSANFQYDMNGQRFYQSSSHWNGQQKQTYYVDLTVALEMPKIAFSSYYSSLFMLFS